MDYRDLLVKYIRHVGACEGVTYIPGYERDTAFISTGEWAELHQLDREAHTAGELALAEAEARRLWAQGR